MIARPGRFIVATLVITLTACTSTLSGTETTTPVESTASPPTSTDPEPQELTGLGRPAFEPAVASAPRCPDPAQVGIPAAGGPALWASVMDSRSGLVVAVDGPGTTWVFDVCRGLWAQRPAVGPRTQPKLVFHENAGLVIAIPRDLRDPVWTYSSEMDRWSKLPAPELIGDRGGMTQLLENGVAYDPGRANLLAWASTARSVWAYDVTSNTWTRVDDPRADPPTPAEIPNLDIAYVAFDASVDRLVLAQGPTLSDTTWLFDPATGTWEAGDVPAHVGAWHTGREMLYDPAQQVTVLYNGGLLGDYDARQDQWRTLVNQAPVLGALNRSRIVYDSVHQRLLALVSQEPGQPPPTTPAFLFDSASTSWLPLSADKAVPAGQP